MSMKRPLLSILLLLGTTALVHAQVAAPSGPAAPPKPATLFNATDGGTAAANPVRAAGVAPAAQRAGAAQPWLLDLPKPDASGGQADGGANPAETELSALRYFASQNDLPRVASEIRMLRSKHPGWEPPEDLFGTSQNGEIEKPLWDLFAKHDLAGLHAAMAELQQSKPDWQASSDLVAKITLAEAHDALIKASDAQQWGSVLDVAAANKMLMTCGDVEALWRTAEALIRTDAEPRALEAYRYILTTCTNPGERLATMQKASLLLQSPDDFNSLMQMGHRLPNGKSEFEQVQLDLLRAKIGDAAAGKSDFVPTSAEMDMISAAARTAKDGNDAQLLGWYANAHKDYATAERWFRIGVQSGPTPDAKSAEGLVIALRGEGHLAEAQSLAQLYAPLDHLNRKLMVEVLSASLDDPKSAPLSPDAMANLTSAIELEHSSDGAQALGWHLYKANDLAGADQWFHKSDAWQPNESAAIGLVVMAKRLKHERDYTALVAKYRGTYARIGELDTMMRTASAGASAQPHGHHGAHVRVARGEGEGGRERGWDKSADAIVKTFEGGNYDQAVTMLEQRRQEKGSEPQGLAVVRGWALYHKGNWEGARQVFSSLDNSAHARESQEGLRVIDQGYVGQRYR